MDYNKEGIFSDKALIRLIIPLIIEQFLAIAVGMADTMMVSHAGEAAVSGVSLVDMINNVIIALLAALATGGAVVISQFLGADREESARRAAGQLVNIVSIITVFISIIIIAFAGPLIRLCFGAIDADVYEACRTYLIITAFSFPMLALYNAGAAIFRSLGDSKTSMQISLLMNIINVAGNAVCVFGMGMGVEGVAIPSVISRGAAAAIMIYLAVKRKEGGVYLVPSEVFHFDLSYLKRILYIAIPSGIENSLFQLGRVLVVSIIAGFGTVEIAANAVANNLDGLGITVGNALSIAMITVVGRCVGAGSYTQAEHYTKKLIKMSYIGVALPSAVILLFLNGFFALYAVSEQTRELASILVWIHLGIGILIWPLSFVLPNALRAANDVRFTMGVSLFSMAVFRLGTSFLLAHFFKIGAIGVWIAMITDWIFRVACFVLRFKSGRWKLIRIG